MTLKELLQKCSTPWDLSKWMGFNLSYIPIKDKYQQVDETLKTGKGDCVALAILAYEWLKEKGFKPHLIELKPKMGEGHTICAFKDTHWKYFSNDVLVNCGVTADSLKDVARFYKYDWSWRETDTEGYNI